MTEDTAEEKAARRAKDEEFLDKLTAAVELVPVIELSRMTPSKREPFEGMFGQYGTEKHVAGQARRTLFCGLTI